MDTNIFSKSLVRGPLCTVLILAQRGGGLRRGHPQEPHEKYLTPHKFQGHSEVRLFIFRLQEGISTQFTPVGVPYVSWGTLTPSPSLASSNITATGGTLVLLEDVAALALGQATRAGPGGTMCSAPRMHGGTDGPASSPRAGHSSGGQLLPPAGRRAPPRPRLHLPSASPVIAGPVLSARRKATQVLSPRLMGVGGCHTPSQNRELVLAIPGSPVRSSPELGVCRERGGPTRGSPGVPARRAPVRRA